MFEQEECGSSSFQYNDLDEGDGCVWFAFLPFSVRRLVFLDVAVGMYFCWRSCSWVGSRT